MASIRCALVVLGFAGLDAGRVARLLVGATGLGPRAIPRGLQVYNPRSSATPL